MRVDHLVCRDPVYESQERLSLDTVSGKGRQHGQTHLLRDVVRRGGRPVRRTEAGATVAHDQRPDDGQDTPDGLSIALHRGGDQLIGNVCRVTHRGLLYGRYLALAVSSDRENGHGESRSVSRDAPPP